MTKPKRLKMKECICADCDRECYNPKQIRSAVEWLKNQCFRHLIDGSMETRDNLSTYDLHELIDEAFEDVIKND